VLSDIYRQHDWIVAKGCGGQSRMSVSLGVW